MANLLCQILVCVVAVVQFNVVEGKEQLLQYTGLDNDNRGLTNLREEIRYHSRMTRDVSQSSSPGNMTKNGTVSPSSAPGNTTETIRDDHTYYSSEFHSDGSKFWVDISDRKGASRHDFLSNNSLARATVRMSFDFPYYGHLIRDLQATSSGFVNLGTPTFSITEVQYVAPLLAYFNPGLSHNASVSYYDDGNQFIVQWTNVRLHEDVQAGPFTFQCILKKDGTILFVYKTIPIKVQNISTASHPVKVGVSDSFHIDFPIQILGITYFLRRYFIYHEVMLNFNQITSGSAFILNPKATCITAKSCGECIDRRMNTAFDCTWCRKIGRCSDGLDRQHSEWRENDCFNSGVNATELCNVTTTTAAAPTTATRPTTTATPAATEAATAATEATAKRTTRAARTAEPTATARTTEPTEAARTTEATTATNIPRDGGETAGLNSAAASSGLSGGAIAAIVIFLLVIPLLIFGAVVTYAYLHPTSPAGLYLIEHNPRKLFRSKGNQAVRYENHK